MPPEEEDQIQPLLHVDQDQIQSLLHVDQHERAVDDYFHPHRERPARRNAFWPWAVICTVISVCVGQVIAVTLLGQPPNWANKIAAVAVCLWAMAHCFGVTLVQWRMSQRGER